MNPQAVVESLAARAGQSISELLTEIAQLTVYANGLATENKALTAELAVFKAPPEPPAFGEQETLNP